MGVGDGFGVPAMDVVTGGVEVGVEGGVVTRGEVAGVVSGTGVVVVRVVIPAVVVGGLVVIVETVVPPMVKL
jgi:hypothetical protein